MTAPRIPHLGADLGRVSGWVDASLPEVARLLLPGRDERGSWVPWPEAARRGGVDLTPALRFSDLAASAGGELAGAGAMLSPPLTAALVEALTGQTSTPDAVHVALWPGYADPEDAGLPECDDADRLPRLLTDRSGGLVVGRASLGWLALRATTWPPPRLPVLMWPSDGAWLAACPIYADSLVVSGTPATMAALRTAGFTVLALSPEDPLPTEGD